MDIPDFLYWYKAEFIRATDGDTVEVWVDFGFNHKQKMKLRLLGINAPEMVGATHEAGVAARDFLINLLLDTAGTDTFFVKSYKDKADKYGGRWLAELFINKNGVVTEVNKMMIDSGHAKPYNP